MAEAMIAGLLRGNLVTPDQVVASHPRAERRAALERDPRDPGRRVEHRGRRRGRRRHPRGQAPDARARRPRDRAVTCGRASSCCRSSPGPTTSALVATLGHDQVVRAMPNTPARIGNGMTVWYATPATTAEQRSQAKALLSALGAELEVEDEKWVAMATAISGTGPAYVFLVMEALIDAAVHLGFPRHIAHDLVIETLEGSTRFAKQSGDHPAVLRNMVTSPAGHQRRRAPRARVGPPPHRALRGGLGRLPPHRGAGRPDGGPGRRRREGARTRSRPQARALSRRTPGAGRPPSGLAGRASSFATLSSSALSACVLRLEVAPGSARPRGRSRPRRCRSSRTAGRRPCPGCSGRP